MTNRKSSMIFYNKVNYKTLGQNLLYVQGFHKTELSVHGQLQL